MIYLGTPYAPVTKKVSVNYQVPPSPFVGEVKSIGMLFWGLTYIYGSTHGQSSYWTAKSSFLFLASDHTEADPNYTLGVDFWTMISYNLKNSG